MVCAAWRDAFPLSWFFLFYYESPRSTGPFLHVAFRYFFDLVSPPGLTIGFPFSFDPPPPPFCSVISKTPPAENFFPGFHVAPVGLRQRLRTPSFLRSLRLSPFGGDVRALFWLTLVFNRQVLYSKIFRTFLPFPVATL